MALATMLASLTIAGCAADQPPRSELNQIQQRLMGKTKQELVACAGAPLKERVQDETVQLIYYREASILEESFPSSKGSVSRIHHGCRATIMLQDERVSGIQYQSIPTSSHDEDHCDELFELCASPKSVP